MTNLEFKNVRFHQRFENYQKSLKQLTEGLQIESPSKIEEVGLIKIFELTFELAWKTLKDYLESEGVEAKFPREVIKAGVASEILLNGDVWLEMLEGRNLLSHVYNQNQAESILKLINKTYILELILLENIFLTKLN